MKFLNRNNIRFYTLILSEQEIQAHVNNESLRDFLEERICVVFNLPKEHEYFLRYALTSSGNAYHCLLLDKEALKKSVSDVECYLSHPCFLCRQFVAESFAYILVKDSNLEWTFIGYAKQDIVYFSALEDLKSLQEKLEALELNTFWVWGVGAITKSEQDVFKQLSEQFSINFIPQEIKNVELLESFNFNPLEKSLPFIKTRMGSVLKWFAIGLTLGLSLWIALVFVGLIQQRKNTSLEAQIILLQNELETLGKSRTKAQKEMLALQEKLESLQAVYQANVESLKGFENTDIQVAQLVQTLNPYLKTHQVKIAYFAMDKEWFALLLFGKNALKILEILERESLGNVQVVENYGDFVWSEIQAKKKSNEDF
ncbi:hypothetical protein LS70_006280 [Helicobacter sp. MIT 11-5569]|uniref:hypothetical protein n=1 Tax=Helicobacter sp. MIT 11-5569 TaxID=1548151 RepID=UPI00051FB5F5|nr:hypothetical protein [Helicobacter sp. MIT 11-5569]TLD82895.1 hypothetical protein LS70_006280 [Helicobacter sp. MIT 11-5569]